PAEAKIIDSVRIRVLDDKVHWKAYAVTDGERLEIHISEGFLFGLHSYIVALQIEEQLGKGRLSAHWMRNLLDGPSWRSWQLVSVAEFAGLSEEEEARFEAWDATTNTIQLTYIAALQSVVLHELGHHVLGVYSVPNRPSETLKNEKACDDWAIRILGQMGYPPAVGVAGFFYLFEIDEYNFTSDRAQTHPRALERAARCVKATRAMKSSFNGVSSATVESLCDAIEGDIKWRQREYDFQSAERLEAHVERLMEKFEKEKARGNRRDAAALYRRIAQENVKLARFYQTGTGGVERDLERAFVHFTLAHVSRDAWGSLWFATCLYKGWGCDRDRQKAVEVMDQLDRAGFRHARSIVNGWRTVLHKQGR
ncbi:MAG: hypothetical protein AAF658_07155, partial [Myxococcota bacterium]